MKSIKNTDHTSAFARIRQIRRVINKYALNELFDDLDLPKSARFFLKLGLVSFNTNSDANTHTRAQRIRMALEELGPVFVKLGQTLSTRPDLLPEDIALELSKLQDKVPPFSATTSLEIIKKAYGDELDQIFSDIEEQPLASASVAQVHAATLQPGLAIAGQNGEANNHVVIKLIRPGIESVINSDLNVMRMGARFLQRFWSRSNQFRPLDVISEYENTIRDELDLRIEAANGARMGADFESSNLIYVPRIYWDFTHQNVLVMERVYGESIREIELFKARGVNLQKLAEDGVSVFFRQAFECNFFHADMHAGNIFVSDEGGWIAIDFGIMGTLSDADKRYLGEILLGFFNRDYAAIVKVHIRSGWVPAGTKAAEFEQAIRVVCEPIFAKPLSEISFGNILMQLFQTVQRFEMPVQPQLVLLYKTLLNIEGLGRQLYPELNLWDTAKPFLENWMKQQLSPQKLFNDLKRDWPQWQHAIEQLPATLENLPKDNLAEIKNNDNSNANLLALILVSTSAFSLLASHLELINLGKLETVMPWLGAIGAVMLILQRKTR